MVLQMTAAYDDHLQSDGIFVVPIKENQFIEM